MIEPPFGTRIRRFRSSGRVWTYSQTGEGGILKAVSGQLTASANSFEALILACEEAVRCANEVKPPAITPTILLLDICTCTRLLRDQILAEYGDKSDQWIALEVAAMEMDKLIDLIPGARDLILKVLKLK